MPLPMSVALSLCVAHKCIICFHCICVCLLGCLFLSMCGSVLPWGWAVIRNSLDHLVSDNISVSLCACLPVSLYISLSSCCASVYMSVCLSVYLSSCCLFIYLYICLFVWLPVCLSLSFSLCPLSVYLSVSRSRSLSGYFYVSVCLSMSLCVFISVSLALSVYLSVYLPVVCLSVCFISVHCCVCVLYICMSICLFVCLCICLSIVCMSIYLSVSLYVCWNHSSNCRRCCCSVRGTGGSGARDGGRREHAGCEALPPEGVQRNVRIPQGGRDAARQEPSHGYEHSSFHYTIIIARAVNFFKNLNG